MKFASPNGGIWILQFVISCQFVKNYPIIRAQRTAHITNLHEQRDEKGRLRVACNQLTPLWVRIFLKKLREFGTLATISGMSFQELLLVSFGCCHPRISFPQIKDDTFAGCLAQQCSNPRTRRARAVEHEMRRGSSSLPNVFLRFLECLELATHWGSLKHVKA